MNPLTVPSEAERGQQLADYVQFLRVRDGEPDPVRRTLSRREAWFRELAARPVRSSRPIDREAFYRNLRRPPEPGLEARLLWLLGVAKVNTGERYGVELALERKRGFGRASDEVMRYVQLEELVHTHLLLHCCHIFGLEVEPLSPPLRLRALIELMVRVPHTLARPLTLCAEIVGAVMFQVLRERADVFGDEPEVVARLRTLVDEILIDELGHISFHRMGTGGAGMRVARRLLPLFARTLARDNEEIARLAGGEEGLVERVLRFELDGVSHVGG